MKVQSLFRGKQAKREAQRKKEEKEENKGIRQSMNIDRCISQEQPSDSCESRAKTRQKKRARKEEGRAARASLDIDILGKPWKMR